MSADIKGTLKNALELINDLINTIYKKLLVQPVALHGELDILHIRNGQVIDSRHYTNMVMDVGKAEVAGLINGSTSGAFTYMAIGVGTDPEDHAETGLFSEITTGGGARAAASCTRVTTTYTNDTAQWVKTWTFSAGFAVTESGIFDDPTAGIMLCRKTFGAINVVSADQLQITWKDQVTASIS